MIKKIKKGAKRVLFSRGTHVDATWHSGPRGSATGRLRGADVTSIFIYIVSKRVIIHISIPYSEFKLTRLFNAHYNADTFP